VRAENRDGSIGDFVQFLDEARALALERFHDVAIVDDLVPDVDGLTVLFERTLDDVDGANDAGTEAAWLGENDAHAIPLIGLF
jgi:hypothetical protein